MLPPKGKLFNMKADEIGDVLKKYRNVAVVGLSKDEGKDSYRVAAFLKKNGFRIIPINPTANEILGEKSYPSLSSLPAELKRELEIVDIFRPSEAVPPIVDEAIGIRDMFGRPMVIWMQLGITNEGAARKASEKGILVIQDRCMMIEGANRKDMLSFKLGHLDVGN